MTVGGRIQRIDAATFTNPSAIVTSAGSAGGPINLADYVPERLTTDGTYLYTNNDNSAHRGKIAKYSITEEGGGAFSLYQEWLADCGAANRFGQPGYYNGKVYAHDWQGVYNVYEIDATTAAVTWMGTNGRRSTAISRVGDQILAIGQFSAVVDIIPVVGSSLGSRVSETISAGERKGFGATAGSPMNGFFTHTEDGVIQYWVPEPATLAVLALGGLAALFRRR
jgi:hypothetical protein